MSFHTKYRGMMHPPGAAGIVSPGLLFIAPFFFGGIYMVHADAGQRGLPLPPVWLFPIVMLSIGALKPMETAASRSAMERNVATIF